MTVYVGGTVLSTALPTGTNLGYEYIINGADHTGGVFTLFAGTSDLQEVDNISIKEVLVDDIPRIDYTNSTFDDVLGSETVSNGDFEELGAELITNGTFNTDSGWSKGTGWTITGGQAVAVNTNGNLERFVPSVIGGKVYEITFDYTYTSGGVILYAFGNNLGNLQETKQYSFTTTATGSTTKFQFYGVGTNLNATIDNVSVKEVDPNDEWSKVNST